MHSLRDSRDVDPQPHFGCTVLRFDASQTATRVTVTNAGIAPPYHDAFVTIDGTRAKQSLRGLLPGEERTYEVASRTQSPQLTIESDRLVVGQRIQYEAALD